MFDRFTDRARMVMSLAKGEAQRHKHDFIGTEHILLGVVAEGRGVAASVLRNLDVDFRRLRDEVEKLMHAEAKAPLSANLPFTPRAKRVLELSVEEASNLGHDSIGTEHLLLGLLKEEQGIAAKVLASSGVKLEEAREEILEIVDADAHSGAESTRSDDSQFFNLTPRRSSEAELNTRIDERARASGGVVEQVGLARPPKSTLRIGVIGAGGIVMNAHLPGYQRAGYRVTAICDVNRAAADAAAKKFGIAAVCDSVQELLARKDVDVIDVAIPEHGRPAVLPAILESRKPTLLQKPLAYSLETAKKIVDDFERAKVPLAVNQNLRWSPEFAHAKRLLASGALGKVFDLRWTMRNTSDSRSWAKGSWYSRDPRFQVLSWSIHHLDAFRFLLDDEAERVYCALPRRPDQNFVGDVCATVVMHFQEGAHVSMIDSNASTPGRPEVQLLDVDGSEGSITFSVAKPRYFAWWLRKEIEGEQQDARTHVAKLEGEWYPDGFAGAMGDLLEAVEKGREPSVSGRRNLGTMALVDACYRSAAAKQAVDVAKV